MDMEGGEVCQCSEPEADYFGVYVGEPGNLMWVADFDEYIYAREFAVHIAGYCKISDLVQVERGAK